MDQCRAAQVDQRCNLLRRLDRPWLEFEYAQRLQPGQYADQQQRGKQKERTPEKADAGTSTRYLRRRLRLQRQRAAGHARRTIGHGIQAAPSGTNT